MMMSLVKDHTLPSFVMCSVHNSHIIVISTQFVLVLINLYQCGQMKIVQRRGEKVMRWRHNSLLADSRPRFLARWTVMILPGIPYPAMFCLQCHCVWAWFRGINERCQLFLANVANGDRCLKVLPWSWPVPVTEPLSPRMGVGHIPGLSQPANRVAVEIANHNSHNFLLPPIPEPVTISSRRVLLASGNKWKLEWVFTCKSTWQEHTRTRWEV